MLVCTAVCTARTKGALAELTAGRLAHKAVQKDGSAVQCCAAATRCSCRRGSSSERGDHWTGGALDAFTESCRGRVWGSSL